MVRCAIGFAAGLLASAPAWPADLIATLFPGKSGCYGRSYSNTHLAKHTEQLVTEISVVADDMVADPMLGLWVFMELRGDIADSYEGFAYCENTGGSLSCGMEGDAGSFTLSPDGDGTVLIEVGPYGMSFEGDAGFITLMSDRGDDRSFRLAPAACG